MSEKSAQFNKVLKKNVDKIVLVVLLAILGGLGYTWWQEQSEKLAAGNTDGVPANLQDTLPGNPAVAILAGMTKNPKLDNSAEIQKVAQFNMFDYKTIRDRQALEQSSQQNVTQAQALIQQNRPEAARPLLEKALNEFPGNGKARELLDSITTQTAVSPTPAGEPGAMPGAVPGAPQ